MLNTFFFGYLPLKWRRLTRVLIILGYLVWIFMLLQGVEQNGIDLFIISMFLMPVIPVGLISWVVKPFIVKD